MENTMSSIDEEDLFDENELENNDSETDTLPQIEEMDEKEFEEFLDAFYGDDIPEDFEESEKKKRKRSELNSLKIYLKEIGQYKELSEIEEYSVAKRAAEGDKEAKEILYKSNLRHVVSVAKEFRFTGIPLGDLIQEGNIGLYAALDKYDYTRKSKKKDNSAETKPVRFITYARSYVRKYILHAIYEQTGAVRIPENMRVQINAVNKKEKELLKTLDRYPTNKEIADGLAGMSPNMTEERVRELKALVLAATSLDVSITDEDGNEIKLVDTLNEGFPAKSELEFSKEAEKKRMEAKKRAKTFLDSLSPRERKVIALKFGLEGSAKSRKTQDIAKILDVSVERVDQIIQGSILLMRRDYKRENIEFDDSDNIDVDYII